MIYTAHKKLAEKQAESFLNTHELPVYERIQYNDNTITVLWRIEKPPVPISEMKDMADARYIMKDIVWKTDVLALPGPNNTSTVIVSHSYKTCVGYEFSLENWVKPAAPALPGQAVTAALPRVSAAISFNRSDIV
jgi:hypothetical protein